MRTRSVPRSCSLTLLLALLVPACDKGEEAPPAGKEKPAKVEEKETPTEPFWW